MDSSSFVASVDGLRSSLEEGGLREERLKEDVEKISSIVHSEWLKRTLSNTGEDDSKKCERIEKITQSAVRLWNTAVAKHAGKTLSSRNNAILRQLCFDLVSCAIESPLGEDKNEIRRTIMMGVKVGKAWHDVGENEKALDALETTKFRVETLMKTITKEGNPDWYLADKMSLQQDLFSVICGMSEVMSSRGRNDEVVKLVDKASNLPILSGSIVGEVADDFSGEIEKLCGLTYNFGLKSANGQRYGEAIHWLSRSFEAGKRGKSIRPSVLAKILRLLAHCFSETRSEEGDHKALNALELAKGYGSHPAGLHLKLKILARNNATHNDAIEPVLNDLLSRPNLSIELALSVCRHLNAQNRFVLCEKAMENLLKKYATPQAARIHAQRFEYTLHRLGGNEALDFARTFLGEEHTVRNMDKDSKKSIHMLMWEQAEKRQKQSDTGGVLSWYDLSLRFHGLTSDGTEDNEVTENIAKIQRNRSACMISLGRLEEAKMAANESAKLDAENPRSDFTLFKIAVGEGKESDAIAIINRLARKFDTNMEVDNAVAEKTPNATIHGLVCLCAQLAFEREEHTAAVTALEHVANTTDNRTAKLIALRCLVRLQLRQMEDGPKETAGINENRKPSRENVLGNALQSIEDAFKVLLDVSNRPLRDNEVESRRQMALSSQNERSECTGELVQDEAEWFMKISWNMALESKLLPWLMKRLFRLCYEFLGLLVSDTAILTRQKTCLLMSCAAALEVARSSDNKNDLDKELRFSLDMIEKHKEICRRLHGDSTSVREDKEALLRSLYEFEARAKSTPPSHSHRDGMVTAEMEELERLLEIIFSMPQTTVKTLETIATLCVEQPANHVNLSKRALKTAIRKLDSTLDASGDQYMREVAVRYSTLYRTLVGLALQEGGATDPVSKEEALLYIRNALELADGKLKKLYPEQECLWLTVKSWNVGVRLYAAQHILQAENWCSSAMRFLVHLKHYKSSYDAHMNEVYQEILDKKNLLMLETRAMEIS